MPTALPGSGPRAVRPAGPWSTHRAGRPTGAHGQGVGTTPRSCVSLPPTHGVVSLRSRSFAGGWEPAGSTRVFFDDASYPPTRLVQRTGTGSRYKYQMRFSYSFRPVDCLSWDLGGTVRQDEEAEPDGAAGSSTGTSGAMRTALVVRIGARAQERRRHQEARSVLGGLGLLERGPR